MKNKRFAAFDQALSLDDQGMIEKLAAARGWEAKYRQIMLLGKSLPALEQADKIDNHLVKGCESQAWLYMATDSEGRCHFAADSDARIVKGLLVIVLSAYQGKTLQQIGEFDIEHYFGQLDLLKHLSPSRANGIHAVVKSIQAQAAA